MMASKGNGLNLPYIGKSLLASVKLFVLAGDLMFTLCLIYCITFTYCKKPPPNHQKKKKKKKRAAHLKAISLEICAVQV